MFDKPGLVLPAAYMADLRAIDTVLDDTSRVSVPWLLVHGTDDDLVPLQHSLDAYSHATTLTKKLVEVKGADHVFDPDKTETAVNAVVERSPESSASSRRSSRRTSTVRTPPSQSGSETSVTVCSVTRSGAGASSPAHARWPRHAASNSPPRHNRAGRRPRSATATSTTPATRGTAADHQAPSPTASASTTAARSLTVQRRGRAPAAVVRIEFADNVAHGTNPTSFRTPAGRRLGAPRSDPTTRLLRSLADSPVPTGLPGI